MKSEIREYRRAKRKQFHIKKKGQVGPKNRPTWEKKINYQLTCFLSIFLVVSEYRILDFIEYS